MSRSASLLCFSPSLPPSVRRFASRVFWHKNVDDRHFLACFYIPALFVTRSLGNFARNAGNIDVTLRKLFRSAVGPPRCCGPATPPAWTLACLERTGCTICATTFGKTLVRVNSGEGWTLRCGMDWTYRNMLSIYIYGILRVALKGLGEGSPPFSQKLIERGLTPSINFGPKN